jgi:two-component sensor histidine kinase
MQLVCSLVDQLDGELDFKRNNGIEFLIKFKVIEKRLSDTRLAPILVDND